MIAAGRVVVAMGLAGLALLLIPGVAFADNCSGLFDCWGTAAAAGAAAAGAGAIGAAAAGAGTAGGEPAPGGDGGQSQDPSDGSASEEPPKPEEYPPNRRMPGEREQDYRKRVRDHYLDIRMGKRPPRTIDDAMRDLQQQVDEFNRTTTIEVEEPGDTATAIRG